MWSRSVQSVCAIYDQVPIVANLHPLAAQRDKPFDIKLVLWHARVLDASGFKDNDFAARRMPKIVGEAIDKQMIAGDFFEIHNRFTFAKALAGVDPGAFGKAVIRRKPQ